MKKIVFESLNEVISFKREGNPLSTLGIGQRKLIENWLEEMEIFKYEINDDLTINKYNDVWLNSKSLYNFPNYIQFNEIKNGFFTIENNIFTSLRGCPKYVENSFVCSRNSLTSLEGCPKIVKHNFYCRRNKIKFSEEYVKNLCKVTGTIFNI